MRKICLSALAAALIGGAMLLSGPSPVSATAFPGSAIASPGDTSMVEEVGSHRRSERRARREARRERRYDRRERRYDRRWHGARYSYRRPGFNYHYGGYYYANPWWLAAPAIGLGVTIPAAPVGSGHVEWCLNRFRSYDVASDTYLGFDGYRHRCNSPFH